MRVTISQEDTLRLVAALRACEDAEEGSDGSFTIDFYEPEPAVTVEIYPESEGYVITAAAKLVYSEEFEGFSMGERIYDEVDLHALSERIAREFLQ